MRKTIIAAGLLTLASGLAAAQPTAQTSAPPPTLKSILLAQLKSTHNSQEWFVPASKAVEGMTAEQAAWKPGNGGHSVAQLVHHLIFWDRRQLDRFEGKTAGAYDGNNDETFEPKADAATWTAAVRDLDAVMTEWETAVANADDAKLSSWYATIAHITTHNAYHTGQILYVRKLQGSWDSAKGVK